MSVNNRPPTRGGFKPKQASLLYANASRLIPGSTSGEAGPSGQFSGTRDVYAAAGYKSQITYADVLAAWQREHIARRLIDIFPDYTWRKTPVMIDGPNLDGPRDTEFCDAWNRLWDSGRVTPEGDTMIGLDYWVPELDRVAMMGKWAVMFLGFADDAPLSEPVVQGQFNGPDFLAYTSVYSEANATVSSWESDPTSPRYGKPLTYNLNAKRGGESFGIDSVHWTRVIHLAHNGLADLVEGLSAIHHVFNLLQDLLKVIAGTGESGYRNADPGMIIKTQPTFEAPEAGDALDSFLGDDAELDEEYLETLKDGVESYIHGLQRYMVLEGYDVDMLTGAVADPRGPVSTLIDLVSGATGIPQRLLLGNEAGELASTQDQANWASVIETRQVKVAQPLILRPLVNRLVWAGVLPEPVEGLGSQTPFTIQWPNLYSVDPKTEAEVADIVARVLASIGVVVDPEVFLAAYLPDLDPGSILPAGVPVASPAVPTEGTEDDPSGENPFTNTSPVHFGPRTTPINGGSYP